MTLTNLPHAAGWPLRLVGGSLHPHQPGERSDMTPLQRANWNLAVLSELAGPSSMQLDATLDRYDQLVDFEWVSADPLSALTLGCPGHDLARQRLTQAGLEPPLQATLFDLYRRAWRSGQTQMASVRAGDWSGIQTVCRSGAGLSVVVSSSEAVEKVIAARAVLHALLRERKETWR